MIVDNNKNKNTIIFDDLDTDDTEENNIADTTDDNTINIINNDNNINNDINQEKIPLEPAEEPENQSLLDEIAALKEANNILQQEFDLLEEENEKILNDKTTIEERFNRLQDDWNNYKTRTINETQQVKREANINIIKILLPIIDDFERALTYSTDITHNDTNPHTQEILKLTNDGMLSIYKKLINVLIKENIKQINPLNETFNSEYHQAIKVEQNNNTEPETVLEVIQKGYILDNTLIRPAIVVISN